MKKEESEKLPIGTFLLFGNNFVDIKRTKRKILCLCDLNPRGRVDITGSMFTVESEWDYRQCTVAPAWVRKLYIEE